MRRGAALGMLYSAELERLQKLLHFPEEVALQLTEVEYELYYRVPPIAYVRHVTSDLRPRPHADNLPATPSVAHLTKRFQEVRTAILYRPISLYACTSIYPLFYSIYLHSSTIAFKRPLLYAGAHLFCICDG